MLIQMLTQQPRAIFTIVANTPVWVWGVLAALIALGVSQCFARSAGLRRVLLLPTGLALFSGWGITSAFGAAVNLSSALAVWLTTAAVVTVLVLWSFSAPPAGTRYDAASQIYQLPGSIVPLLLTLAIFLLKYGVGVELAMQPSLAKDGTFAQQIALMYGAINGILMARAGRLLRLAQRKVTALDVSAS